MPRLWAIAFLLAALLYHQSLCQDSETDEDICLLSREEVRARLNRDTRTWNLTGEAVEDLGIQAIVNCTEEGDVISLQKTGIIQPSSRIVIPWTLTIEGSVDANENAAKATLTCPTEEGLFLVRSAGIVLRNLVIQGCDLFQENNVAGIIQIEECPQFDVEDAQLPIELQSVDIMNNRNRGGSVGIVINEPDCYSVVMQDMLFQSNVYAGRSSLSSSNLLERVRITGNRPEIDEVFDPESYSPDDPTTTVPTENATVYGTLFHFPSNSRTVINNMTAENNTGALIHVDQANLEAFDSDFTNNNFTGGRVVFAVASNVSFRSCLFESNHCWGGVIHLSHVVRAEFFSVRFVGNVAFGTGAVSLFEPEDVEFLSCMFESNTALTTLQNDGDGGALRIAGRQTSSTDKAVTISDCHFTENSAVRDGGAIVLDRIQRLTLDINNSTFRQNMAGDDEAFQRGGALGVRYSDNCTLTLNGSVFESNQAWQGGGVYMTSSSGRINFLASQFARNVAGQDGGAVYLLLLSDAGHAIVFNKTEFESNLAMESGDGGAVYASQTTARIEMINSTFNENRAERGGAVYAGNLESIQIRNCRFSTNQADYEGGGVQAYIVLWFWIDQCAFVENKARSGGGAALQTTTDTHSDIVDTTFIRNEALSGGGLYAYETYLIISRCSFEENRADLYGGGLFTVAGQQSAKTTFRSVNLTRNAAQFGGGAFFQIDHPDYDDADMCTISFLETTFESNHAERAGGGFFIDRIRGLCSYTPDCNQDLYTSAPFSMEQGVHASNVECLWIRNSSVNETGYGRNIATAAMSFYLMVMDDAAAKNYSVGETARIAGHRSGDPLPNMQMTLFDHFHQGPAVTKSRSALNTTLSGDPMLDYNAFAKATIESRSPDPLESLISAQLTTNVASGTGNITFIPLQRPGEYSLDLFVGDDDSANITVNVTLRGCVVNEEPNLSDTVCNACDSNECNFYPETDRCRRCSMNADCSFVFVLPLPGFWNAFPCAENVQKCINEDACKAVTVSEVMEKLEELGDNTTDCEFSPEFLEWYRKSLCEEGYAEELCGSCTDSAGKVGIFTCRQCVSTGAAVLLMLISVLILTILVLIQMRGNLKSVHHSAQPQTSSEIKHRSTKMFRRSERYISINDEQTESGRTARAERGEGSTQSESYMYKHQLARSKFLELLKITINFLQTVAAAISLDVPWTDATVRLFRTWDYVGGAAIDTSGFSADCLLTTDLSTPRSVIKQTLVICMPVFVLVTISAFWTVKCFGKRQGRLSYLAKRILLTVVVVSYVSYISLTTAAINVFYCVNVYDETNLRLASETHEYWAVDTAVKCFEESHMNLVIYAGIPVLFFSVFFPISLAATLLTAQRSQKLGTSWIVETVGLFFRGFEARLIFWDSVILLRKALIAAIVVFSYSLEGTLQGHLALFVLVVSLFLQTTLCPFKSCFGFLNHVESISLLVSSLTFLAGIMLSDPVVEGNSIDGFLVAFVLLCNVGFALLLLTLLTRVRIQEIKFSLLADGVNIESKSSFSVLWTFLLLHYHQAREIVRTFFKRQNEA